MCLSLTSISTPEINRMQPLFRLIIINLLFLPYVKYMSGVTFFALFTFFPESFVFPYAIVIADESRLLLCT